MNLKVLGSSSLGNCYLLESEHSALVIEAGIPFRDVKVAIDFNVKKIAGLIVSHAHSDHAGRASEFAAAGINVYSSLECLTSVGLTGHRVNPIEVNKKYAIGEFTAMAFDLLHDVRNYGYLIFHPEMGLCCFLTDTHYSPFVFPGLNHIIVEANYSEHIIEQRVISGSLHSALAKRIQSSHMADTTMLGFLKANDLSKVNNIVIIHLSSGNSDAADITEKVINLTGKRPVIAGAGVTVEFNINSF